MNNDYYSNYYHIMLPFNLHSLHSLKSYYFVPVELAEKEGVNLGAIAMAFEGYILSKYVSDNDFGMTFMLKLLFV